MTAFDFKAELDGCRRRLGARPRQFGWWDKVSYLHTARPAWCTSGDRLSLYFKHRGELLRGGQVVWGHVVQANRLLFSPGTANCPGDVVYGLPPDEDVGPEYLGGVARAVGSLKERPGGSPAMEALGAHLANERTRVFGLPVPPALSPLIPCALSTVFFDRKHLPGRVLRAPFFPLVVSARDPRIAMVLPARYWSPALCALWQGGP